jgi:Tfp pilus assembly protein PilE
MMLKKKYLKGNTIIEVLIALAITSFCSSLAVIIYLNIQKSSLPFFKIKAVELAEYHMKETLQKRTFTEETYKEEEFTVKKIISSHEAFNDCYVIRMVVFDANKKKLFELESTVYRDK